MRSLKYGYWLKNLQRWQNPRLGLRRHHMVAGGSGFIGNHLTRYMLARGERVLVYDRGLSPFKMLRTPSRAACVQRDVARDDLFADIPQPGLDYVWNLTCGQPPGIDGARAERTVIGGTARLLALAAESGAVYIHVADTRVDAGADSHARELQDTGIAMVQNARDAGQIAHVAWLGHVYGPFATGYPGEPVPPLLSDLLAGEPLRIGSDSACHHLLYARDAAAALFRLARRERSADVSICHPECVPLSEVAWQLAWLFDGECDVISEPPGHPIPAAPPKPAGWHLDELRGRAPRVSLRDGLRRSLQIARDA